MVSKFWYRIVSYWLTGPVFYGSNGGGSSQPQAPSPNITANEQLDLNKKTSAFDATLNRFQQTGPTGDISWQNLGTQDQPYWKQTTSLSGPQQDLYNQQLTNQLRSSERAAAKGGQAWDLLASPTQGADPTALNRVNDISGQGLRQVSNDPLNRMTDISNRPLLGANQTASNNINTLVNNGQTQNYGGQAANFVNDKINNSRFDAANSRELGILNQDISGGDLATRQHVEQGLFDRLNPQLDRQDANLRTTLANQGLSYGGQAYTNAMGDQNRAVNDARLAVIGQGGQEMQRSQQMDLARRQQGMSELTDTQQQINQARNQALSEMGQGQNLQNIQRNQRISENTALGSELQRNQQMQLAARNQGLTQAQSLSTEQQRLQQEDLAQRNQKLQEAGQYQDLNAQNQQMQNIQRNQALAEWSALNTGAGTVNIPGYNGPTALNTGGAPDLAALVSQNYAAQTGQNNARLAAQNGTTNAALGALGTVAGAYAGSKFG